MKVKIKDIQANPFRNLDNYPIDKDKVARLRKSFKHTGFWDNIVARENGNGVQIAYGHHRLMALRKEYDSHEKVDLIIKNIDDASMIKIMADENDDLYGSSPAVVNETVKATRDFLLLGRPKFGDRDKQTKEVAKFLDWDLNKVQESMAALKSIEEGAIEKDVYESFPTQTQADEFRKVVKANKVPLLKQRVIAKKLTDKKVASRQIKSAIVNEVYKKSKDDKRLELLDYLYKELTPIIRKVNFRINDLYKFRKQISGLKGQIFWTECKKLHVVLGDFLSQGEVKKQIRG